MPDLTQLEEAIVRLDTASQQAATFANGDAQTTVPTDNGPIPTLAKLIADAQAAIAAALSMKQLSTTTIAALQAAPAQPLETNTVSLVYNADVLALEFWVLRPATAMEVNDPVNGVITPADYTTALPPRAWYRS